MVQEKQLTSIIAPYIKGLLEEKHALGYDYHSAELILYRFDRYCAAAGLAAVNISRDFMNAWMEQKESEGSFNQGKRISVVRQLMLYMASLGISVYIPEDFCHFEKKMPHILSCGEIDAFFREIDSYSPCGYGSRYRGLIRLSREYRVLFRMIYTCGLRNSEAAGIGIQEVDLESGILTILNAKRQKDRLVYMADDLTCLCREYYDYICSELGTEPAWFFPALDPERPLANTAVDRRFNDAWKKTSYAACCNDKPVVHDLRFTFVTNRINQWIEAGEDINVLLPYLSMYLGHKSVKETHYYYHHTLDASRIIHRLDRTSGIVIPEVVSYE